VRESEGLKSRESEKSAIVKAVGREVAEVKVLNFRQTLQSFREECFGRESGSWETVNSEGLKVSPVVVERQEGGFLERLELARHDQTELLGIRLDALLFLMRGDLDKPLHLLQVCSRGQGMEDLAERVVVDRRKTRKALKVGTGHDE
jgi:hypothetical protein